METDDILSDQMQISRPELLVLLCAVSVRISSRTLQAEIEKLGTPCEYFPSFDQIENFLLENCEPDDLLITMGAGDVYKIGENLLGK